MCAWFVCVCVYVLTPCQSYNILRYHTHHNQVCQRYIVDRGCILAVGTGHDPKTVGAFAKENLAIFDFQLTTKEVQALSAL